MRKRSTDPSSQLTAPDSPLNSPLLETLRRNGRGRVVFGRFKLIRELGIGGMAVVWLAHDQRLKIEVALKFLTGRLANDAGTLDELRDEITKGLRVTHAGIVRLYDLHENAAEEMAAIAMEYIDGPTLAQEKLRQPDRCFDVNERLDRWMAALCEVLSYLHDRARVVHRDVKPGNLMLTQKGELKLADFGIAASLSHTHSGRAQQGEDSGTPLYMSPQQGAREPSVPADDIYAVGATLYELLTSKAPFFLGSRKQVQRQKESEVPPSMEARRRALGVLHRAPIPAEWEAAVAACLQRDPAKRPASARELQARLALPSLPTPGDIDSAWTVRKTPPQATEPDWHERTRPAVEAERPEPSTVAEPDEPADFEAPDFQLPTRREPLVVFLLLALLIVGAAAWWRKTQQDSPSPEADPVSQSVRIGVPKMAFDGAPFLFLTHGSMDGHGRVEAQSNLAAWDFTAPYHGELTLVRKKGLWGVVNGDGRVIAEPRWESVGPLIPEGAIVSRAGKKGLLDPQGRSAEPQWDFIGTFQEGRAPVSLEKKWGMIDAAGKVLFEPQWEYLQSSSDGLAPAKDGKWGAIDRNGNFLIKPEWDALRPFSEGLAGVRVGTKYSWIDKAGQLLTPAEWEDVGSFSGGHALAKKGGKYGLVDHRGQLVVEPQWDGVGRFINGLAAVRTDKSWGAINHKGEVVVPAAWDAITPLTGGLLSMMRDKKFGLLNRLNEVVVPPEWEQLSELPNQYLYLSRRENARSFQFSIRDPSGREIWHGDVPSPELIEVPVVFPHIKDALSHAAAGQTILVSAGAYEESLKMVDGVRLVGESRDKVTVRWPSTASVLSASECATGEIADLTFEHADSNAAERRFPVVMLKNCSLELRRVRVRNGAGEGIRMTGNRSLVSSSEITGNFWNGVAIDGPSTVRIEHCRLAENLLYGIFFSEGAHGVCEQNLLVRNGKAGIGGGGTIILDGNLDDSGPVPPKPTPTTPKPVPTTSPPKPKPLIVPTNYATIQEAIDRATAGDTVQVRAGKYTESLRLKPGVSLIGESADKITIQAPVGGVVLNIAACPSGIISDLSFEHQGESKELKRFPVINLQGSKVEVLRCKIRRAGGHGISIGNGDTSSVRSCEIADAAWSGIHVMGTGTKTTLQGNICTRGMVGIDVSDSATGQFEKNRCEQNSGSGIMCLGRSFGLVLLENVCLRNLHGIYFGEQCSGSLEKNDCHENKDCGIAVRTGGTMRLIGNRCNDNLKFGIAIDIKTVPPLFLDNTATGNKTSQIDRKVAF